MLYKKKHTPNLDMELFKNPTSEYRGAPFWAWNCQLDKETLKEQIEYLKEMGFGGFHMHTRSGMATQYLSDDFMELVKTCVQKAHDEDMLAWLYDEDRWPSGSAGGVVTKIKKFRQKFLHFSQEPNPDAVSKEDGIRDGHPYLFGCYDIVLNEKNELQSYRNILPDDPASGCKWYAYICTPEESGWYNNQTYIDTLSKEAVDEFIRITHESYKQAVGRDFGDIIPAIFTDEPQYASKSVFPFARNCKFASMPWTTDLEKSYQEKYNINLTAALPELFWDLPEHKPSRVRYCFHDHVCELFTASYMDNCSEWCRENGIALTGHVFEEETLQSQSNVIGEAMRTYRSMAIPGIDMLCDRVELSTAKQAQSVVHQYGKEAMLSELYGVTNWDFDFRGHKFQGDWQAALGVTVRVPHLSWVSMKGSAKRDFPASFNYQAPWYREYSCIEDHFARLNTVLTRGKPLVSVGVIHPVESDWLYIGPEDTNFDIRRQMQVNFENMINWLLFGLIDFDFISESLLADIGSANVEHLTVGKMQYSVIIVPGCETMRRTTLELLQMFQKKGGKLIFCGEYPKYIDAVESNEVKELFEASVQIPMSRYRLLDTLIEERFLDIKTDSGQSSENLIHTLRKDGDVIWLFIAHGKKDFCPGRFIAQGKDVSYPQNLQIKLKGEFIPILYNTLEGEKEPLFCYYENGFTMIPVTLFENDSMLIELTAGRQNISMPDTAMPQLLETFRFHDAQLYTKDEPNVYLLDLAEYQLDQGEFQEIEEVLRIDEKCRKLLDYPMANGIDTQPWVSSKQDEIPHTVTLRYCIDSEIEVKNAQLAAEEVCEVSLNGEAVELKPNGYYVDKSIITYDMPTLRKGSNILIVKVPLGKRISVECMYLLGDFNVSVSGTCKKITSPSETLHFDNITSQGLPFYGGNITYQTEIFAPEDCSAEIFAGKYRGALIKILIDGKDAGRIIFSPYKLSIPYLSMGKHTISFILYGNRANTFASVHNYSSSRWFGPGHWYAKDERGFCYEYCLKETGILVSPTVKLFKKQNY